jgi:hypothetical protein
MRTASVGRPPHFTLRGPREMGGARLSKPYAHAATAVSGAACARTRTTDQPQNQRGGQPDAARFSSRQPPHTATGTHSRLTRSGAKNQILGGFDGLGQQFFNTGFAQAIAEARQ